MLRRFGLFLMCLALLGCGGGGPATGGGGGGSAAPPNPKPAITGITQATLTFNVQPTVTISGSGFIPGSEVQVDNQFVAPVVVSGTEMQLPVPPNLGVGTHSVVVINTGPGGGKSNAVTLTIVNTVPVLQAISPAQATAGEASLVLTLTGSNFNSSTYAVFNGMGSNTYPLYQVQLQDGNQIQFVVGGLAGGAAGYMPVSVVNPGPGGGTSNTVIFPISSQPLVVSTPIPSQLTRDSGDIPVGVSGSGFNLSTVAQFNGVPIGATGLGGVWGTEIGFTVPGSLLHSTGTFPLTISNPAPGANSVTINVAVVNPQPVLTSMSPAGAGAGSGPVTITLAGSGFEPESVASLNGQALATSFVSKTQLTATAPASQLTSSGVYQLTVSTPAPGGGVTQPQYFGVGSGGRSVLDAAMPGGTRLSFTSTLLADGRVLITGGQDAQFNATPAALLYDPTTSTFTATGSMQTPRQSHTATLLPDGRVLIVGGLVQAGGSVTPASFTATAELYDPATGTFSATGSMAQGRASATATLLPNGDVLIAGGYTLSGELASTEIFDPATNAFTAGANLTNASIGRGSANLLASGSVLLSTAGGTLQADLYNPSANTMAATGSQDQSQSLAPTAPLPNGDILVAGGLGTSASTGAERYQTNLGTWQDVSPLRQARFEGSATLLPNGKALFAGGTSFDDMQGLLSANEVFDAALNQFSFTGFLPGTLMLHNATLLQDGSVLLLGGVGTLAGTAVRYLPSPPTTAFIPTLTAATAKSLAPGTWVIVQGNPFFPGAVVTLDGTTLPTIYLDTTLISFKLPSATAAGPHTLTVTNPGGSASAPLTVQLP